MIAGRDRPSSPPTRGHTHAHTHACTHTRTHIHSLGEGPELSVPLDAQLEFLSQSKDIEGLLRWLCGKEFSCQCRKHKRHSFDPWVRKIPWRRKWQPTLQYPCLGNPMDRGAWWATVHEVINSGTRLNAHKDSKEGRKAFLFSSGQAHPQHHTGGLPT